MLFDPALLHSNGVLSGTMNEFLSCFTDEIRLKDISRLSLAIRILHKDNIDGEFLWMSAPEKKETFTRYFNRRAEQNGTPYTSINKNSKKIFTVLSNNKIQSDDSPYFSVNEIYKLHKNTNRSSASKTHFTQPEIAEKF